jgi:hypothetical protein
MSLNVETAHEQSGESHPTGQWFSLSMYHKEVRDVSPGNPRQHAIP